jgi:hypothetical protein
MEFSIETQPDLLAGDDFHLAFIQKFCVPELLKLRNEDGGWGFREASASRVEPTAWAILALRAASEKNSDAGAAVASSEKFLEGAQLADGSWASAPGQTQGSWVTSLACGALRSSEEQAGRADRGLRWLLAERPRESSLWWRIKRRVSSGGRAAKQDDSFYGWSWTHGTASWVEPTAYACLALRGSKEISAVADKRLQLAEKMLFDRVCAGGGWNTGNPATYGAVGSPEFGPTAFALLALRGQAARQENQQGVAWIEQNWASVKTPSALALAAITLRAYGCANAAILEQLRASWENEEVLKTVPAMAWTLLAMSGDLNWLPAANLQGVR